MLAAGPAGGGSLRRGHSEESELTAARQVLRGTGEVVSEGSSEVNLEFLR